MYVKNRRQRTPRQHRPDAINSLVGLEQTNPFWICAGVTCLRGLHKSVMLFQVLLVINCSDNKSHVSGNICHVRSGWWKPAGTEC